MRRFGKGARPSVEPSRERLDQEAAAEMRRIAAPAAPHWSADRPAPAVAPRPPEALPASDHRSAEGPAIAGRRRPSAGPPNPGEWSEEADEGDDDEEPLTPEEERQAVTAFALLQLAERDGHQAVPEDLAFEPTDPFVAETMRDRALQRFFGQREARPGIPRVPGGPGGGGGSRTEAQRAQTSVKWTVGSRPRAVPPKKPSPREVSGSRAVRTGRTPKAAPVERAPARKPTAKKLPAKAQPAKKAPTKKSVAGRPTKAAEPKQPAAKKPAMGRTTKAETAPVEKRPGQRRTRPPSD